MTKGRELPVNSKVRRRLFSEDQPVPKECQWNEADYRSRVFKIEYIAQNLKNEVILKGMKWNFDFENEVAMDGPIQWYRKGNAGEWVGMQPSGRIINMHKRHRDPESTVKFVNEDEKSKMRKLPLHSVVQGQVLFNDGKAIENAKAQIEDDNATNFCMDDSKFDRVSLEAPVHLQRVSSSILIYPNYKSQIINDDSDFNTTTSSGSSYNSDLSSLFDDSDSDGTSDEEKGDKIEKKIKNAKKEDEMTGVEDAIEMTDASNNAINENDEEANDDSNIVQEPEKIYNKDQSSINGGKFENLRIYENINSDLEVQMVSQEKPNDFKEVNEATPKNERNGSVPPVRKTISKAQVKKEMTKRRLFNNHL